MISRPQDTSTVNVIQVQSSACPRISTHSHSTSPELARRDKTHISWCSLRLARYLLYSSTRSLWVFIPSLARRFSICSSLRCSNRRSASVFPAYGSSSSSCRSCSGSCGGNAVVVGVPEDSGSAEADFCFDFFFFFFFMPPAIVPLSLSAPPVGGSQPRGKSEQGTELRRKGSCTCRRVVLFSHRCCCCGEAEEGSRLGLECPGVVESERLASWHYLRPTFSLYRVYRNHIH